MTATGRAHSDPELDIGGRRVRVTNPDRVLWPATGFTKRAMLAYYERVADVLLPHVRDRGLTLRRFPEGVDGPGWYQANCRGHPPWVRTHDVVGRRGGRLRYCVIDDTAGLAWAANLGTIEFHPFLATTDRPDEPTALVLDLDPGPPAGLTRCAQLAIELRRLLHGLGLEAVAKTSGGLGLHVYVPLAPGHSFAATKAFARAIAATLARRWPDRVIDRTARSERAGRVLIDWVQNDVSRSTVAPYSLRAMPWPLVSTPVTWAEVAAAADGARGRRLVFGPDEVVERVRRFGDLFEPALSRAGVLPDPTAVA